MLLYRTTDGLHHSYKKAKDKGGKWKNPVLEPIFMIPWRASDPIWMMWVEISKEALSKGKKREFCSIISYEATQSLVQGLQSLIRYLMSLSLNECLKRHWEILSCQENSTNFWRLGSQFSNPKTQIVKVIPAPKNQNWNSCSCASVPSLSEGEAGGNPSTGGPNAMF